MTFSHNPNTAAATAVTYPARPKNTCVGINSSRRCADITGYKYEKKPPIH